MSNHPNRGKDRGPGSNPKPEEILRAREAAGLTQEQAGVLLFSGWRSWQDWERGERRMHPATWELFNIKVRARKLLADEAIAAELVKRLGIHLPPTD